MNHLSSTLVLCDLDHLLLGADGNLAQVVRDVLQLFVRRGGRFTVFSQRTPRAVRSILGSVRLSAPALVCGGAMAYHFSDGTHQPLCTFAGQDADLFARLPVAEGVGIALQMTDGTTRVLRMSEALGVICGRNGPLICWQTRQTSREEVRVLLYQDSKAVPMISLLEKSLGDRTAVLLGERAAADTLILTPEPSLAVKCWMPCVCRWASTRKMCWYLPEGCLCWTWCALPARAPQLRMPRLSCVLLPKGHFDRCCGRFCSGSAVPYGAGC